jgi:hypothetical protein
MGQKRYVVSAVNKSGATTWTPSVDADIVSALAADDATVVNGVRVNGNPTLTMQLELAPELDPVPPTADVIDAEITVKDWKLITTSTPNTILRLTLNSDHDLATHTTATTTTGSSVLADDYTGVGPPDGAAIILATVGAGTNTKTLEVDQIFVDFNYTASTAR